MSSLWFKFPTISCFLPRLTLFPQQLPRADGVTGNGRGGPLRLSSTQGDEYCTRGGHEGADLGQMRT